MKRIYRPFIKGTNWALAGLLSLMGFSGCELTGAEEYGVPHTEFTIKGKVTDPEGNGIPDIRITAKLGYDQDYVHEEGATKTNENGEYNMTIDTFRQQTVGVIAEDIDAEKNGFFEADSTFIPKEEVILTGGKSWFEGRGSKEVNFKLKKKTAENE